MVHAYLNSQPTIFMYDFLRHNFAALQSRFNGIASTTFRTFPSFPQQYLERFGEQPVCETNRPGVPVMRTNTRQTPISYTQADFRVQQFTRSAASNQPTSSCVSPHKPYDSGGQESRRPRQKLSA